MVRWLLPLASCVTLAACGGLGVGSEGPPTPNQTRAQATARYAQLLRSGTPALQIAVEKDQTATIALREVIRDGVESFVSSDGVVLKTRRGLLVGTAGLGADMAGSDVSQSLALVARRSSGTAERFHTFLNGENEAVTRSYVCVVALRGRRSIQVGTRAGALTQVATTLVEEDCRSLDQSFTNLYWLSAGSGEVLQSRQWAGDLTGPLVMRRVIE
ncbi:YjbF family lipoprotein [Vannielia litorea]|uniref:YjbF family lipoprotein n=1 Tax=Vannielia litorea TaxID=1217970 RepID=UPI001C966F5B|nr:YjbF family lipoprotein [Vannielia litorea]MBY6046487.1 YjbF family lipoprotein [Vannielia litorea]MBY6073900.1 YjbF family lipoprotein [Vannielia litorea]